MWLEALEGYKDSIKPRGKAVIYEPLEWSGLLWLDYQGMVRRLSYHSGKQEYRSQADYEKEPNQFVFNIAARYLDLPLTEAVLQRLNFTAFAEEVLMQMEADTTHAGVELAEKKYVINRLERRLTNLEDQWGWEHGKQDQRILTQIEKISNY